MGSPFTPQPLCDEAAGALLIQPQGRYLHHSPDCRVVVSSTAASAGTAFQRATRLHAFAIDPASGALTEAPELARGSWPAETADPAGRYLFGVHGYYEVGVMAVDPLTGSVRDVPGTPFLVGDPARLAQVMVLGAGPAPDTP